MEKKFYRSSSNCMIAGVCGGLAEYFNVDPVLVRAVFFGALIFGTFGFWVYMLLWILTPQRIRKYNGQ